MKKLLIKCSILMLCCITSNIAIAQEQDKSSKHEVKLGINSGLVAFKGNSKHNYNTLIQDLNQKNFWKNSPYGKDGAIILGASLNYKRISPNNWIFTIDAGYELLRNKMYIDSIYDAQTGNTTAAEGTRKVTYNFLNLSPMLGYRINLAIISLDLQAGVEFGYMLSSEEKRDIKDAFGNIYQNIINNNPLAIDVRPKAQINLNFPRTSWYVGYSEGIINYNKDNNLNNEKSVTSMFRFGVQLRLF